MIELLLALALIGGATGAGHWVLQWIGSPLHDRAETVVLSFALGLGTLILGTLVLGLAGALYRPVVWGLVGIWCLAGWRLLWMRGATYAGGLRSLRVNLRSPYVWLGLLAAVAVLLQLIRALAPPHGATDPLAYQLGLPQLYLMSHKLDFNATVTGALYPANMALLYVVGLALRNGILAQILHLSLACAVSAGIFAAGRRYLTWQSGLFGAAIFSSMPVIVVFAPQAYVDVGLCFFQFTALWAVANWAQTPGRRALLLAALLSGLAAGTKHQGIATLLVGIVIIVSRRILVDRDLRGGAADVAMYVLIAMALVVPWYARAWAYTGNPVWPLANSLFQGVEFGFQPVVVSGDSGGEASAWWSALVPSAAWFDTYGRSMSPWYWTFAPSGWQKAIGVYFIALLPGALLLWRRPGVRPLLAFCLGYYIVIVRVLHMNPRYGLVLFAVASLLCGAVAHRLATTWRPARVLFLGVFLATVGFNLAWSYVLAQPFLPVALGSEGRDVFLTRSEANYRLFRFINDNTRADATVLLQGIVKGFYCERYYLWDHPHQAVLQYDESSDPTRLLADFNRLGISHVARMIQIPGGRVGLGYPQYFTNDYHEEFRRRYLRLIYRDESFALFEVVYPQDAVAQGAS